MFACFYISIRNNRMNFVNLPKRLQVKEMVIKSLLDFCLEWKSEESEQISPCQASQVVLKEIHL